MPALARVSVMSVFVTLWSLIGPSPSNDGQPPGTTLIDCDESGTVVTALNDADEVVGFTGALSQAVGFVRDLDEDREDHQSSRDRHDGNDERDRRSPHHSTRHDARCTPLRAPGAAATLPFGINDRGQIVGSYVGEVDGAAHGFLYSNRRWTVIDIPGSCETYVTGINNRGQIVGFFANICGAGRVERQFLRQPDGTVVLLNPPATSTRAFAINARGDIVGSFRTGPNQESGFLRKRSGAIVPIGIPAGFEQVTPMSINADGKVVGVLFTEWHPNPFSPDCQSFYFAGTGPLRRSSRLTIDGVEAPTCTYGINSSGEIGGAYFGPDGVPHGFVARKSVLFRRASAQLG